MDDKTLINSITSKVEKIVSQYEQAVAQNEVLSAKILEYQDKLDQKKLKEQELTDKIKTLQNKIENLQLVEAMRASGETDRNAEARRRVDKLISQIDECIALLDI